MSHFSLCATRHLRGYPCRLFELLVYPLTHIFPFHRSLEKKGKRSQEKFLWSSPLNTRQHNTSHQIRLSNDHLLLQLLDESGVLLLLLGGLQMHQKLEGYLGSRIHIMVRYIIRLYGAHTILKASRNCVCLHVQCRTVTMQTV